MKQPYIYTMPEAFIHDEAVPIRWRLLAILNGFFLNNRKCWASNEWLGEQITAHKDSVSQGIKELEKMGLISAIRTRRTRLIYPVLKSEIGGNAYQEGASTPISDRSERLSNSDSSSDSLLNAPENDFSSDGKEEIESSRTPTDGEGNELHAKTKKEKVALPAAHEWVDIWNRYPNYRATGLSGSPINPSAVKNVLPSASKTNDIIAGVLTRRRKYGTEDFERAVKKYASEICNRVKDKNGYYMHRYSMYEFLTHKTVLEKYVN